jgi:hypothetical protein
VIQQCLYVDALRRAEFEVALAQLGDGLYIEFINGIGAAGTSQVLTPDGGTIPTAARRPETTVPIGFIGGAAVRRGVKAVPAPFDSTIW